jgi:two-component system OmpR family response regulator
VDRAAPAIRHGKLSLDPESWEACFAGTPVPLTVTEFGILRTLAGLPSKVFSRDALIDRLRGPGFALTDRTIDSHVRNLRAKFAQAGGNDLIETRPGIGYRIGPCSGD